MLEYLSSMHGAQVQSPRPPTQRFVFVLIQCVQNRKGESVNPLLKEGMILYSSTQSSM